MYDQNVQPQEFVSRHFSGFEESWSPRVSSTHVTDCTKQVDSYFILIYSKHVLIVDKTGKS